MLDAADPVRSRREGCVDSRRTRQSPALPRSRARARTRTAKRPRTRRRRPGQYLLAAPKRLVPAVPTDGWEGVRIAPRGAKTMRTGYLRQPAARSHVGRPTSAPECGRGSQVRQAGSRADACLSRQAIASRRLGGTAPCLCKVRYADRSESAAVARGCRRIPSGCTKVTTAFWGDLTGARLAAEAELPRPKWPSAESTSCH